MRIFFPCAIDLDKFTRQLFIHKNDLVCKNCHRDHCFMSHGFVYKKEQYGKRKIVGKRLFCSNRSGHTGCGATLRLYLAHELSKLHYNAKHLLIFIMALLANTTIQHAYFKATSTKEPRNAFRWLKKLKNKIIEYRQFIINQKNKVESVTIIRLESLSILLPTLANLFATPGSISCSEYQLTTQAHFI